MAVRGILYTGSIYETTSENSFPKWVKRFHHDEKCIAHIDVDECRLVDWMRNRWRGAYRREYCGHGRYHSKRPALCGSNVNRSIQSYGHRHERSSGDLERERYQLQRQR